MGDRNEGICYACVILIYVASHHTTIFRGWQSTIDARKGFSDDLKAIGDVAPHKCDNRSKAITALRCDKARL